MDQEKEAIILAGLLHDIGKFWERADKDSSDLKLTDEEKKKISKYDNKRKKYSNEHVFWTKQFFSDYEKFFLKIPDISLAREMAIYHHKPPDQWSGIIRDADWLSSGHDRREKEEEENEMRIEDERRYKVRLSSVFPKISLLRPKQKDERYYELNPLFENPHNIFPKKTDEFTPPYGDFINAAYRALWDNFVEEFIRLPKSNFDIFITSLYYLLLKYTWCIPSTTEQGKTQNISLFDHLKTTAAIAVCLYDWAQANAYKKIEVCEKRLMLLEGDLSGIQNYIYGITQPRGVKGISKRLRGRSFYVTLLNEMIARYILRKLKLPICNLIFCAGGVFDILLPDTEEARKDIKKARAEIEEFMLEKFLGTLGIVLDYEEWEIVKKEDGKIGLEDYGLFLDRLKTKVSEAKKKKYLESWRKSSFPQKEITYICKACQVNIPSASDDSGVCDDCKAQKELGEIQPKGSTIVFSKADIKELEPKKEKKRPFKLSFGCLGTVYVLKPEEASLINDTVLSNPDVSDVKSINPTKNVQVGFTFLGNTVPYAREKLKFPEADEDESKEVEKGDILSFTHLANYMSIGDKKLGYLKMDVDNLGLIFSLGLRSEKKPEGWGSISRFSTMSWMLDAFFSAYINHICDEQFSEWKKVGNLEHNDKISNIFYICYSGGDDLLIIGPWSEIPKLAQKIQQKFKEFTCHNDNISLSGGVFLAKPKFTIGRASKLAGAELDKSKDHGKDRITLFGDTVTWKDQNSDMGFDSLIHDGDEFFGLINEKKIARGFVHGLLRKRKQFLREDKNELDHNFLPALIYQITRTVKDEEVRKKLKEKLVSATNSYKLFKAIRIPAIYALMKSRKV